MLQAENDRDAAVQHCATLQYEASQREQRKHMIKVLRTEIASLAKQLEASVNAHDATKQKLLVAEAAADSANTALQQVVKQRAAHIAAAGQVRSLYTALQCRVCIIVHLSTQGDQNLIGQQTSSHWPSIMFALSL